MKFQPTGWRGLTWRLLGCCFLTLAPARCGGTPEGTNPISAGPPGTVNDARIFADDADPATAALAFVDHQLLVQPYPGAGPAALSDLYERSGAAVIDRLEAIQLTVLEVVSGTLEGVAAELAQSDLIESIHKDYILTTQAIPDDPDFVQQAYLSRIGMAEAWALSVGANAITIAIVDTGVQRDHPDLADRITDGWNIYDDNGRYDDPIDHGTLVAGVLAASTDNRLGVAGVTWTGPLLVVRAADDAGQTTSRHAAAGILWALSRGAKVINVSFAPLWSNSVVRSAARQAYNQGSLVVISAGNGGGATSAPGYEEALFVGAVDDADNPAWFSDRGPFVDIAAPGTGIYSTAIGSRYRPADGTSFAAPIVTGVAALAWSVNPELRPVSIVQALLSTALDAGEQGPDDAYGHGIIDAGAAVSAAAAASSVPDRAPPSLSIQRPTQGDVVSGRFTASVTATDRWGVADVVISVDDLPVATDTRAPYRFVLDTDEFDAGIHELSVVATDLAGNATDAKSVSVVFANAGGTTFGRSATVEFLSPAPGAQVSGVVQIKASVASDAGLAAIEWRVDGVSMLVTALSGTSSGVSYGWRASEASRGRHTITVVITDAEGGQATGSLDLVAR